MNRFPNINLPATEKQIKYLKRLTKQDVNAVDMSKYDAWEKIQRILRERGDPNVKAIKNPTLIEFLTLNQLQPLIKQLGKLSIELDGIKYSDDFIDNQFGVVSFEIYSDVKINNIMIIEDAKDYVETIIIQKMKRNFRAKYSLGVIFQQNLNYQVSLYKLFQFYYTQYHPEIKTNIVIS